MPWDHNSLSNSCPDPGEPLLNLGHETCPNNMGLLILLKCQTYVFPEFCPGLSRWGEMGILAVI